MNASPFPIHIPIEPQQRLEPLARWPMGRSEAEQLIKDISELSRAFDEMCERQERREKAQRQ